MFFLADSCAIMEKAREQFRIFTSNDEIREIIEARENFERDRQSRLDNAKKEGIIKGRSEGLRQGRSEGLVQGIHETNVNNAKKMLALNMNIQTIADVTGLSVEEIQLLK